MNFLPASNSDDDLKKSGKEAHELQAYNDITEGKVTPLEDFPDNEDPEYAARVAKLGLDPNSEHGAVQRNLKERHLAMVGPASCTL